MKDSPHDKLFKEAFGNPYNAAAEIRSVAPPALVARMDFASLTALPGSFRDVALVYVLFEHKSATDRWVPFQLLRYMVRIWERCRQEDPGLEQLPPILPLVVHHNDTGWTAGADFSDIMDSVVRDMPELARLTPRFEFLLDDVGRSTDEQIRARAFNAYGVLALLFLRDARTPERFLGAFAHWADLLRELDRAPDGRRALMVLFRYLSIVLDESAWPKVQRVVHTALPETEETLMSMAEKWLQEGRRELLAEQLETKFGTVDERALRSLAAADEPALKRYAQRILTATTLDEVFASQA